MRLKTIFIVLLILLCQGAVWGQDITTITDNQDVLTVDVTVYGVKDKNAYKTALPIVEHALFFRGFQDSFYHKEPLTGTNENFANTHPAYFKEMFDNGRFTSFISSSGLVFYDKKAKPKVTTMRFVINTGALRQDLEAQGVKRRFGLY